MKIMCSWCVSEGRIAYLGMRGSGSDSRVSHAICEGHLVQLRAEGRGKRNVTHSSNQTSPSFPAKDFLASDRAEA